MAFSRQTPKGLLKIKTSRPVGKKTLQSIVVDVRHMLRLDDDLTSFYQAMNAHPDFAWVSHNGASRMLRSPTVVEDLVKMICSTNCSSAPTEKMVTGLVQNL